MRPARCVSLATIAAAMLLAGCSSSHHANGPAATSSTTAPASSTTTAGPPPSSTTTRPSSPTTTSTTTSTTSVPGPRFVSLIGPRTPVLCNSPTSVRIAWETRGADRVSLSINGAGVFASYTNGRHDELEPLACDGTPQVYEFVARSRDGRTATRTLTLTERMST